MRGYHVSLAALGVVGLGSLLQVRAVWVGDTCGLHASCSPITEAYKQCVNDGGDSKEAKVSCCSALPQYQDVKDLEVCEDVDTSVIYCCQALGDTGTVPPEVTITSSPASELIDPVPEPGIKLPPFLPGPPIIHPAPETATCGMYSACLPITSEWKTCVQLGGETKEARAQCCAVLQLTKDIQPWEFCEREEDSSLYCCQNNDQLVLKSPPMPPLGIVPPRLPSDADPTVSTPNIKHAVNPNDPAVSGPALEQGPVGDYICAAGQYLPRMKNERRRSLKMVDVPTCKPCPAGTYWPGAHDTHACIQCPDDRPMSNEASTALEHCGSCGEGMLWRTGGYDWAQCGDVSIMRLMQGECVRCDKYSIWPYDKGTRECVRCPKKRKANKDRTKCLKK